LPPAAPHLQLTLAAPGIQRADIGRCITWFDRRVPGQVRAIENRWNTPIGDKRMTFAERW